MIKIVLSPKSDIQEIVEDVESGLNPFCLLVIKGASFGSWFEADKQMNALSMASKVYSHKKANELAVSVFKLSITSKEEYNEKIKNSYYVPSIKVTLNEPDVAYEFQQFSFKFKELDLFYRVAEVVNEEQSAVDKKTLFKDTDNTSIVESSLLD